MTSLLFLLIFSVAIIFSMVGLGGGVLYVPLLLNAGLPFREAAAVSLSIILVMSLTATLVFHRNKLVDWIMFLWLEPFSIMGAYVASMYSKIIPVLMLQILFSFIAFLSAFLMLKTPKPRDIHPAHKFGFIYRKRPEGEYHINLWAGIPLAFIAGYVSVLLGIGGGFAKVPMMALIFGVPSRIAVATSAAMIVVTASAGVLGYALAGNLDYKLSGILAVAVFLGAIIGSRITTKTDKKFINRVFSVILFIVSGWMLWKAFH